MSNLFVRQPLKAYIGNIVPTPVYRPLVIWINYFFFHQTSIHCKQNTNQSMQKCRRDTVKSPFTLSFVLFLQLLMFFYLYGGSSQLCRCSDYTKDACCKGHQGNAWRNGQTLVCGYGWFGGCILHGSRKRKKSPFILLSPSSFDFVHFRPLRLNIHPLLFDLRLRNRSSLSPSACGGVQQLVCWTCKRFGCVMRGGDIGIDVGFKGYRGYVGYAGCT